MRIFNNLLLKQKLIAIIMITNSSILITASITFLSIDFINVRKKGVKSSYRRGERNRAILHVVLGSLGILLSLFVLLFF